VIDSDKHANLLRNGINHGCKKTRLLNINTLQDPML
jgi:hypothetical protein